MDEYKILVVEDEIIVAQDIKMSLESHGYKITSIVTNGKEAIEEVKKIRPDIILMDIVLQGNMDGIETARKITASYDIPIIYLTAYADYINIEKAKETHPYGYIVKPFEDRELHSNIQMAINKFYSEKEIKERERWFLSILDSVKEGIIVTDNYGAIKYINPEAETMTGWHYKEALLTHVSEVIKLISQETGEELPLLSEQVINNGKSLTFSDYTALLSRNNNEKAVEMIMSPIKNTQEEIVGVTYSITDKSFNSPITVSNKEEYADRNTGLSILKNHFELFKIFNSPLSIAYLDINGLKDVNDNFGQTEGDDLLKIISDILKGNLRKYDTFCRLGSDEFLIVFPMTSITEAEKIVETINQKIEMFNSLNIKLYKISISIGVIEATDTVRNLSSEEFLNLADEEMFRNKKNKKGIRIDFDE